MESTTPNIKVCRQTDGQARRTKAYHLGQTQWSVMVSQKRPYYLA